MKSDILVNIDNLKEIYQIPLSNIPSQDFNIFIQDDEYKFSLQTLSDLKTYLTITKDNNTICANAGIKCNVDLTFLSSHPCPFVVFFGALNESALNNLTYKDFNQKIGLFYGFMA